MIRMWWAGCASTSEVDDSLYTGISTSRGERTTNSLPPFEPALEAETLR